MKYFFFILVLLVHKFTYGSTMINCGPNHIRIWTQSIGYSCMSRMSLPPVYDPMGCNTQNGLPVDTNVFKNFYDSSPRSGITPWWVSQGNLLYPNVSYPGPWAYPNIQSQYYPGEGNVFAAKPNVYVASIHEEVKFEFKFTSEEKLSFLVTTPPLLGKLSWKGKISGKDKFSVDDIFYDYLFYDIRLPKEKMQFENGLCTTREGAIEWMLEDLKEMTYPAVAMQDFEEFGRVKIPDYPFYCIYPQYNHELDKALPVSIDLAQSSFTRSLYILVPHKKEPDMDQVQDVPFPQKDPAEKRPSTKVTRENMFREWGVAFLGN